MMPVLRLRRFTTQKHNLNFIRYVNNNSFNNNHLQYPEEPTTCCMQGCANCVWIDYAEKLRLYYQDGGNRALKEINEKVEDGNMRAFLLHEIRMRQQQQQQEEEEDDEQNK